MKSVADKKSATERKKSGVTGRKKMRRVARLNKPIVWMSGPRQRLHWKKSRCLVIARVRPRVPHRPPPVTKKAMTANQVARTRGGRVHGAANRAGAVAN